MPGSATRSMERAAPAAADTPSRTSSEYAVHMPRLREFAALPRDEPRRACLREQLILAFRPVADHLARRHSMGSSFAYEELTQVGMVAVITAIDRWDPELAGGEFLGYLIPCVRGEMLRWFRDRSWSMRVPRRLKDLSSAIGRVSGPLSQELGRAPRPSELAANLGVDVTEVIDALHAQANHTADSLDATNSETGTSVIDRLAVSDQELEKVEYRHALRPLLDELPDRERMIVTMRFFGDLTQTQIAQHIGISQMHVSRLLSRTLEQLRVRLLDEQHP